MPLEDLGWSVRLIQPALDMSGVVTVHGLFALAAEKCLDDD